MQKPSDYDSVQPYGEFVPLECGGHIMKIIKVEETFSRNGNPMIMIYLDTDKSDKQPLYFKRKYDADTHANKKWTCIVYQLTENLETGGTNPGFKTFITSVEKSNSSSFKVLWGDKFCDCFKGRLVGGVFRREEFLTQKGTRAWATKCCGFRSVAAINEGVEIPKDKPLDETAAGGYPISEAAAVKVNVETGEVMTTETDDDYPF